jgi:hypothetical protein
MKTACAAIALVALFAVAAATTQVTPVVSHEPTLFDWIAVFLTWYMSWFDFLHFVITYQICSGFTFLNTLFDNDEGKAFYRCYQQFPNKVNMKNLA